MKQTIEEVLGKYYLLGQRICDQMRDTLLQSGYTTVDIPTIALEQASFALQEDPYTREQGVSGEWRSRYGRQGIIKFHGDGSFFAEYDVIKPHPTDQRWFVEAVTAWGREDTIKAELRMLPQTD